METNVTFNRRLDIQGGFARFDRYNRLPWLDLFAVLHQPLHKQDRLIIHEFVRCENCLHRQLPFTNSAAVAMIDSVVGNASLSNSRDAGIGCPLDPRRQTF